MYALGIPFLQNIGTDLREFIGKHCRVQILDLYMILS